MVRDNKIKNKTRQVSIEIWGPLASTEEHQLKTCAKSIILHIFDTKKLQILICAVHFQFATIAGRNKVPTINYFMLC